MYFSPSINQNSLSIGNNDETLSTQNTVKNESIINNNNRSTHLDNHGSTSRKITKTEDKTITNHSRENVGGKGATLYRMQQAGMQVPEFITIDVNTIENLEQHDLAIESLKPFINDIENFNLPKISIYNIKQAIQTYYTDQPDKRNLYLQGIAKFIESDACYHQIMGSQTATTIRENYNQLIASLPGSTAIIVRSSGIKEDNYGDAQAGKFESIVHGKQDIIQTCLQVLASAFQPHVCPVSAPQPMALIIQRCIDCSFGGVAMSRTSQNDSRGKIEFVPGQPKGGVSGLEGVTPHCYLVSKDNENEFIAKFTKGNVTAQFSLSQQDANNFTEQAVTVDSTNVNLTDAQLQQIYQYLQQGEDMLLCPADIEFAIAKDGTVYIVQLRPLTVLTGGVNFATEPPANPLAIGTLVSEGFCNGKLVYVNNLKDAEAIPQGAIVVAEHGEDWMLNDDFLKKVGGFIFEQGGTNDHVAITLRQKEKPCLIAKNNFTELKNNHQVVTMACCSFNGTAGAYVVQGGELANKLTTMQATIKASYNHRSSATLVKKTPELTFDRPDIAFKNLHDLNYILLDYFDADGWLNRCFSAKGILLLSMAPHRIEIIKEAWQEIQQMFTYFNTFIKGYKEFLKLGAKPGIYYDQLKQKLAEAEKLANLFPHIQTQLNSSLDNILKQFTNLNKQTTNKGEFNQLLQNTATVFADIQQLNIPKTIYDIHSIHDCIFWIHKEFIEALAPVTINSGLGIITEHGKVISILFSDAEEQKAIEKRCVDALSSLQSHYIPKVVIMENAVIATAKLGVHVCTIEMLEQAEAGKERTLKLKLSDDFIKDDHYQGKLKRFWFLVQALHNLDFAEDADDMKVSVDESTNMLSIEIPHIRTKEIILNKFAKLILVLNLLKDLDTTLNKLIINLDDINWNFSVLQHKTNNISLAENQDDFNFLALLLGYNKFTPDDFYSIYNDTISNGFFELGKKLSDKNIKNLTDADIENIFNKIPINDKAKLLYSLLINKVNTVVSLAKTKHSDWFTDKKHAINLVSNNGMLLEHLTPELRNDAEVVFAAITQNIQALKYAPIQVTNNKEFILNLIKLIKQKNQNKELQLADFPEKLKNNKDVILGIMDELPDIFQSLSDEFRSDKEIALLAVKHNGHNLEYVGKQLKNDKQVVLTAVNNNGLALCYASDKLRNDKQVVLAAVRNKGRALQYASAELKNNKEIILMAIDNNGLAIRCAGSEAKNDADILLVAIKKNDHLFVFASEYLQSNKEFILRALKANYRIFKYLSDKFKHDEEILQAYKEATNK